MVTQTASPEKKRLIVLVPEDMTDISGLAHKIHWMAARDNADVLYLALVEDQSNALAVYRSLATLKALTMGTWLVVESKVTAAGGWLQTLRELYRPGDCIVCHEEQSVETGFFKTLPLADFLQECLQTRTCAVCGYYHPRQAQAHRLAHQALLWTGFVAILSLFTWLEILMTRSAAGLVTKMALFFALVVEFGVLWAWNKFA